MTAFTTGLRLVRFVALRSLSFLQSGSRIMVDLYLRVNNWSNGDFPVLQLCDEVILSSKGIVLLAVEASPAVAAYANDDHIFFDFDSQFPYANWEAICSEDNRYAKFTIAPHIAAVMSTWMHGFGVFRRVSGCDWLLLDNWELGKFQASDFIL